MSATVAKPSSSWIAFCYASLCLSSGILLYGVFQMPIDIWQRMFLIMGIAMFAQATVSVTKTLRDVEEATKLERETSPAVRTVPKEPRTV
jgi:hypothetical protein